MKRHGGALNAHFLVKRTSEKAVYHLYRTFRERQKSTFAKTNIIYNTKSNPYENYGLRVIMTCPCRFISCDKCTALVWDVQMGEAVPVEGGRADTDGISKLSVPFTQFCCEPRLAIKNKVLIFF